MAYEIWPETVPSCFILGTHSESFGDGLLRSKMDMGPDKVRRRSWAPRQLSGTVRMTNTQLESFKTFYNTTLMGGALKFLMDAQGGNARSVCRFIPSPSWQRSTGNTYMVSFSMEVFREIAPLPPVFVTTAMPEAREAVSYNWKPTVMRGTKPYQGFAITAGSLPAGLTFDTATGAIAGSPSVGGTYNFTIRVTDADSRTASLARSITVRYPGFIFAGEGSNRVILDPTVTRASVATYWGADGEMRVAGNNVPRYDYDPITGEFKGVLIEEARTNSSVNFSGYSAIRSTLTSVANVRGMNLFRFVPDTSTATSHQTFFNANFAALTADTPVAVSFIAKSDGVDTNRIALRFADTVGFRVYVFFDLVNGTWLTGHDNSSILSYNANNLGDGFWEIKIVYVARATSTYGTLQIYPASPNSMAVTTYDFNGTDGYLIAHPQIEVGATFATSYIPTTTAPASRAAEAMTVSAGPWLNLSASTVVFEGDTYRALTAVANERASMFFLNGSSQNSFEAFFTSNGIFQITGSGATLGGAGRFGPSPAAPGQRTKAAVAYGDAIIRGVVDGGQVAEVSGRSGPLDLNTLFVGYRGGSGRHLNGHLRSLTYIPRRLTGEELQRITTL